MREPWSILFAGYEDHWLLGPYLWGDEPDWEGLLAEQRLEALSTGERVLLDVACSFRGPWAVLDRDHRVRIAQALLVSLPA